MSERVEWEPNKYQCEWQGCSRPSIEEVTTHWGKMHFCKLHLTADPNEAWTTVKLRLPTEPFNVNTIREQAFHFLPEAGTWEKYLVDKDKPFYYWPAVAIALADEIKRLRMDLNMIQKLGSESLRVGIK